MTKEEFTAKFRGQMLLFLNDVWASRKALPSELGMLMDKHAIDCRRLLGEMYDALKTPQTMPANNGAKPAVAGRVGTP